MSRWFVSTSKAARPTALTGSAIPHAHHTRGISTSWALFAGVSQEDILQSAYWSTPNSFIAYYLKDIPAAESSFSQAALATAARSSRPTS